MPGIFISYRREDSAGYAGRLFDLLGAEFGRSKLFMDVDTLQGGDDYSRVIQQNIVASGVLLAVIGPHWQSLTGPDGKRRLDSPDDFVRIEIRKALDRGIRVIPVLVGGATIPEAKDLPADLQPIVERQAMEIRDSHFHPDVQQLVLMLRNERILARTVVSRPVIASVLLAALVIVAGVLVVARQRPAPPSPPPAAPLNRPAAPAIAGKWRATVKYDWGDSYDETFEFETDGDTVSGTAAFLKYPRPIQNGKLSGNRLSFTTTTLTELNDKTYKDRNNYTGVVSGDTIQFKLNTESEYTEHPIISFVAARVR